MSEEEILPPDAKELIESMKELSVNCEYPRLYRKFKEEGPKRDDEVKQISYKQISYKIVNGLEKYRPLFKITLHLGEEKDRSANLKRSRERTKQENEIERKRLRSIISDELHNVKRDTKFQLLSALADHINKIRESETTEISDTYLTMLFCPMAVEVEIKGAENHDYTMLEGQYERTIFELMMLSPDGLMNLLTRIQSSSDNPH